MRKIGFLISLILFTILSTVSFAQAELVFADYYRERNLINSTDNETVIHSFHYSFSKKKTPYVIVNKDERTASVFNDSGDMTALITVDALAGDGIQEGGSGIYAYAGSYKNEQYGYAERDGKPRALLVGYLPIPQGTPLYVLPQSKEHKFRIRNRRITFGAARVIRNRTGFNYSPLDKKAQPSQFKLKLDDKFTNRYVKTLEQEKTTLMSLLNLENDEYNMLAEFAFGVLAPETKFGTSWKYKLKENAPLLVAILKGNGFDTSKNSNGPTQIKRIPDIVSEHYQIEKGDLSQPESAAITTLAFSADLLRELRNMAHRHPAITEENLQEYLYYLYQGRRKEISKGTATPDQNISIRKIREAISYLTIIEK